MTVAAGPLAISLGDPAGVGPEITAKAYAALRDGGPAFMVVGDYDLLSAVARGQSVRRVSTPDEAARVFPDALPVLDLPLRASVVAGHGSPDHAEAVIRWIETAVGMALTGGVGGVVTCPISKAMLYEAGFSHPGHTEFIAELARDGTPRRPIMMMASPRLRVSLVTIHQALRDVPDAITFERVFQTVRTTADALETDFGIPNPRIALAGLNPHAGEAGALGREELEVINPAARRLRAALYDVTDAQSADTLFGEDARGRYDAVVAMYHDQALIPLKTLDFWEGVNVTLGLPLVRTSPDHGVGYGIAGRGTARADSLIAAIRLAAEIAGRRAAARR